MQLESTEPQESGTASMSKLANSRFLKACRCEPVDCTPIWLMRQAGRYMAEYREIRKHYSMLEIIGTPELAAQVTLQPLDAFDLDAGIIFSDILPPLIDMGMSLDFIKGEGPKIEKPIRNAEDVRKINSCEPGDLMSATLQAIRLASQELEPRGLPLIGFAGAPFTLACYAIQGEGSKVYEIAKQFMFTHRDAWDELMNKLVDVIAGYLVKQALNGASALQVFDSWAGVLSQDDFVNFVQPYNIRLFEQIKAAQVPVIYFSTGTSAYLGEVATCGSDVIGVDWRITLAQAHRQIAAAQPDNNIALQGNLDPSVLLAPWAQLQRQVDSVLTAAAGLPGHIFNLGHGIFPPTPVGTVERLVDYVHESTLR